MAALDGWQRRARWAGVPYAVAKKSGDDNANLLVVALAWYGFTAIFPLLLVVVTVFGFIGAQSIGSGIIRTLHQFPVVGSSFNPASHHALHGSGLGLVIGLIGLVYGAQGVTQTAQQAMAAVWNIPQVQRTGFVPRLGRSPLALPAGTAPGRRAHHRRPAGAGRPRPRRTAPRRPGDRSRLRRPRQHPSRIRRRPAHRPATLTWRGLTFATGWSGTPPPHPRKMPVEN
jgi:hypothetical protein